MGYRNSLPIGNYSAGQRYFEKALPLQAKNCSGAAATSFHKQRRYRCRYYGKTAPLLLKKYNVESKIRN